MKSAIKITSVDMAARKALDIRAGDTVRVWQKIEEITAGKKKGETKKTVRRQAFEGLVLAVKHGTEPGAMFTVRKVASGVGVEKIFPLYSPELLEIEVVRRARMRRAKLYFIRRKASREVSRAMRRARTAAPVALPQEVTDVPEAPAVEENASQEAPVDAK
jgi:large subunit ribosomal protein L19